MTPKKVSHRKVGAATQAAIDNEFVTRQRVTHLEKAHDELVVVLTGLDERLNMFINPDTRTLSHVEAKVGNLLFRNTFWGRLRWLVTGA